MSYSILYNKVAIKSGNGYTVAALFGDNNVWDGNKRARDWNVWHFGQTEKEILSQYSSWSDTDELFQFHGKWVGLKRFKKMLVLSIKRALTVEELINLNHLGWINMSVLIEDPAVGYGNPGYCRRDLNTSVRTTAEFDGFIEKVRELQNITEPKKYIRVKIDLPENIKIKIFPEDDRKVIAKVKGGFYVSGVEEGGYKASKNVAEAIVFASLADAKKQLVGWTNRMQFIDAENAQKRLQDRQFVIVASSRGMQLGYVNNVNRAGFKHSRLLDYAKRYTEKEAQQQIKKLQTRFSSDFCFDIVAAA